MHPSGDHTDSHTYAYDAAGRLVKETVSYDGGEAVDVQKLSYNAIGTLSGNDLGVFNEEYTYNVRGAMAKRKSAVFEQNISFAGKYNGSIASISDQIADGLSMSGWYKYDKAGRLTQANMKVGGTPRCVDYTYDLNSNITTLIRDGDDGIDPIAWIDNMTYEYDGNKVRKITDANGDVISERTMDFPDLADLDVEYTYDRNGNMTGDANKGLEMSWDYNNRLYKVEDDEMTMTFNRTGSGQKLGKSVYVGPKLKDYLRPGVSRSNSLGGYPAFPRDSMLVYPTDSIFHIGNTTLTENFGSYEYVNGKFARLNTSTGYRDSEGTHVYVRDWQGNIRAVVRKGDDGSTVLEQATYYYPYGMPMAESTNPTANRYKYTGKELLTNKGVNIYDYIARAYDPATCRWWSVDEHSADYAPMSHYSMCAGDPINCVDYNGMDTVNINFVDNKWMIEKPIIAEGNDVFIINNGKNTQTYTFSEGEYGKRVCMINLEIGDTQNDATFGVYHISGEAENGTGYYLTRGGESSVEVGSGQRIPDGFYPINAPTSGAKWQKPGVGGSLAPRGVRFHYGTGLISTEGCFILSSSYTYSKGAYHFDKKIQYKPLKISIQHWVLQVFMNTVCQKPTNIVLAQNLTPQ